MALKLYNTFTRQKSEFQPIKDKQVAMYTCGPTVYNHPHIGNLRAYTWVDILRKYFDFHQFKVKHVMNITDVDDKTIKASQENHVSLKDFTSAYTKEFMQNILALNITPPTKIANSTDHIKDMIKIIQDLLDKKIAYQGEDGSVYFSIVKFPDYGKLSKIYKSGIKIGFRINHQEYDKDQAADFVLWKSRTPEDGDVFWKSPFGEGRPGWHIECSAMSMKYLGTHIDIHTGAVDNIFPHHENEIAQSECYTGHKFVNYWLHNEHVLVNGQKMSKRDHNFYILQDIVDQKFTPRDLRYLYIQSHYRSKLNFTWDSIQAAHNVLKNFDKFTARLEKVHTEKPHIPANSYESLFTSSHDLFHEAIEDDLNTPKALSIVHNLTKKINILVQEDKIGKRAATKTLELLHEFDQILGVLFIKSEKIPKKIQKIATDREKARLEKDFSTADKLRKEIEQTGFEIEDTVLGPQIRKK